MPGEPNKEDTKNSQNEDNSEKVVFERTQTDRLNRKLLCSLLDNMNRNDNLSRFWDNSTNSMNGVDGSTSNQFDS